MTKLTDEYIKDIVPKLIRNARQRANMTQAHLARLVNLTPEHISHFECGRRLPSAQNLVRLFYTLNIRIREQLHK